MSQVDPDWHLHGGVPHWHEGGRAAHDHDGPIQPMYPQRQQRSMKRENTSGRVFWVIWCCLWAGVWLIWATLASAEHTPSAALWVAVVLSLAAIWLPVGRTRRRRLPPAGQREIR